MAADKDAGTHLGASALTVRLALRLRAQTLGAARVLEQEMACMVLCWRVCGEGRADQGKVSGDDVAQNGRWSAIGRWSE